jgi:methionyl-tRNA formyltransferase
VALHGDILLQESFPIGENETAGEVHDRMKEIGAQLLVKTVQGLVDGTLKETPQVSVLSTEYSVLRPAPKIFTQTCRIDWTKSLNEIHNLIRGLSPFPGAFTELGDKTLKIFLSEKEPAVPTIKHGRWESDGTTYLKFACRDGYIHLKDIQLEGKKRMMIEEFLRGYRF